MERKVLYFEKPGRDNTEDCLKAVQDILKEGHIRDLVIASTTGETGLRFSEAIKGQGVEYRDCYAFSRVQGAQYHRDAC